MSAILPDFHGCWSCHHGPSLICLAGCARNWSASPAVLLFARLGQPRESHKGVCGLCAVWLLDGTSRIAYMSAVISSSHCIALRIFCRASLFSEEPSMLHTIFFYFTCYSYSLLERQFYLVLIAKLEQKAAICSTGSGGGSRSVRFYCLDCYFCIISLRASPGVFWILCSACGDT